MSARPWLLALLLCGALPAVAVSAEPAATACATDATDLPVEALYGHWTARFGDLPALADVQMGKHPEYAGSVRGTIVRDGRSAQLSGDIDDAGFLILDESQDGLSISAVWAGELQPGSCGREFRGTWRNSGDDRTQPFVLRKTGP
ncbi:hypothetical protein ACSFA2_11375 [Variovorax sp. LT2P21]|uniref:hypothetical protein n=1 Tax=Variovorax sp. LT2P21 TaxID=3443731 RepID=UPI003F47B8F9